MPTLASRIISFNRHIQAPKHDLPNIRLMNPFQENPEALEISEKFYLKYYNDNKPRNFILGINPGRLGAGATGVPFTDTKRLEKVCGIKAGSLSTHEPSSVFVYDMIEAYGGPEKFYGDYYIHSVCPLGLIRLNEKNKWVNCNYYDDPSWFRALKPFIVSSLKTQIGFGLKTEKVFVLGKKNLDFVNVINREEKLFGEFVVLDHPRFIVQYKSKEKEKYIADYLNKLCAKDSKA